MVSETRAAELLSRSPLTLKFWRRMTRKTGEQVGPPWYEDRGRIRYAPAELAVYMAQRKMCATRIREAERA